MTKGCHHCLESGYLSFLLPQGTQRPFIANRSKNKTKVICCSFDKYLDDAEKIGGLKRVLKLVAKYRYFNTPQFSISPNRGEGNEVT